MSVLSWLLSNKLLVFFIVSTTAFAISTIALAVSNANLRTELANKNTDPDDPTPNMEKYRLPRTVIPESYQMKLHPDLSSGLFTATVDVRVAISETVSEIALHSNGLTISQVLMDNEELEFVLEPKYELLVITKKDKSSFAPGNVTFTVDYSGDMKNKIVGMYMSTYQGEKGARNIATTKLEPTYARQVFPCFDEPNMKAKFSLHISRPNDTDYIVLSNSPQKSSTNLENGKVLVEFEDSVPMSTYLVSFIVCDFIATESSFMNNGVQIPFKVFATPEQLSKTTYAAGVGKKAIEYYIDYFGMGYPLPKLDMVAIPDFVSGAMEHWGMVSFRETALLYSSETHSSANKQRVATVIAHELAHSWFGNLVTIDWWNDLWLNEGFATYIEYKGVLAAEPTWGMMDQFLIDDLHPVLSLDATLGSHPIIKTVITPDQITEVFDTISYNKGGSVLRMLENTVGDENFKNGVTAYLKKYEFGNAITQNLLDELSAIVGSKLDITEFMNTFTVQMGYPILDVTINGDEYTLTQKRFLKDPSQIDNTSTPYNYKWTVPITYITDLGKSSDFTLFQYNEPQVTIKKPENAKWIKFNYDQVGYYRVNYPEAEWYKLFDIYSSLSVADRTHLLEETFSIAESGQLSYVVPLNLTEKLTEERDYVPWAVASSMLQKIKKYLTGSEKEKGLDDYIKKIVTPAYEFLSWNESSDTDDDHLKKLARVVVLNLACTVEHEECLTEAKTEFNNWIEAAPAERSLPQDLRSLIYKFGMRSANSTTWNSMFEIFADENDANEKLKLMNGLANVNDATLLEKLLKLAENETYIRSQDYFTLISYIASNPLGVPILWDYMRTNWEALVSRFGLNDRNFGRMIGTVTSSFSTEEKLKEMQAFYEKYPNAGAGAAARAQALETVSNNIKWLEKYKTVVEDWILTKQV